MYIQANERGGDYMTDSKYLTLKDAAHFIGVNERTLKKILDNYTNKIHYSKLNNKYFINKEQLIDVIENKAF